MIFLKRLQHWLLLARLPFLAAGILPFIAGTLYVRFSGGVINWAIFFWALAAITLIMLATNYNGEAYDVREDSVNAAFGKSKFAGGSQIVVEGKERAKVIAAVSWFIFGSAFIIGCVLYWGYHTGPLTLPLGITGAICGFYYSKPPLRWVKRGFGEVLIGYCYGWLPMATGVYLQSAEIPAQIQVLSLPIALSIFNVILINEYLDYVGDARAGKSNLLVRIGKVKAAYVYCAALISAAFFSIHQFVLGFPAKGLAAAIPAVVISGFVGVLLMQGASENRRRLELLCGLTVAVNLLYSLAYIVALL